MVSISRCGRDDPGSNPGDGTFFLKFSPYQKFKMQTKCIVNHDTNNLAHKFFNNLLKFLFTFFRQLKRARSIFRMERLEFV